MRDPRPWQLESDAAAGCVRRTISLYLALDRGSFCRRIRSVQDCGTRNRSRRESNVCSKPRCTPQWNAGERGHRKCLGYFLQRKNLYPGDAGRGLRADTIKVVLNGKDVSDRFSPTSCERAVCTTGTLSSSDGLRPEKNVLYAVAKNEGDRVVSTRLRFAGDDTQAKTQALTSASLDTAQSISALPTASGFLPPTVGH